MGPVPAQSSDKGFRNPGAGKACVRQGHHRHPATSRLRVASACTNRDLDPRCIIWTELNFLPYSRERSAAQIAIASMEAFSITTAFPLVAIPFATSIVTVLGSPKAEPAQPRALIGGHLVSTLVGLLVVKLCGPGPWAAAMAVGLAMVAMHMTGTFHPPAGIDPLVVVVNDMSWSFLVVPVGIGALLLALFAFIWHNLVARGANKADIWPTRWW